jgi:hypothetical protein
MKLKRRRSGSDTSGMFVSAESASDRASLALRALRLSLNTPVLEVEGLPVGPARAAIAWVEAADGAPRVEVAVHSLRTDQVLFFVYPAAPGAEGDPARDFEAALSFAGGMGFLFDGEDLDGTREPAGPDALRVWTEWLGKASPAFGGETGAEAPAGRLGVGRILLTKFRAGSRRAGRGRGGILGRA